MAIRNVTRAGVGLVVGIIILAAVVFAGLWFISERGEQARREDAINIAEQQLQAESDQDIALNGNDTDTTNNNDNTNTDTENSTTGSTDGQQQAQSDQGTYPSTGQSVEQLPETGPADTLAIFGVALVVFTSASYVLSARRLKSLNQ